AERRDTKTTATKRTFATGSHRPSGRRTPRDPRGPRRYRSANEPTPDSELIRQLQLDLVPLAEAPDTVGLVHNAAVRSGVDAQRRGEDEVVRQVPLGAGDELEGRHVRPLRDDGEDRHDRAT